MLLGPGLNIKRSPLGGRNFEYPSEDPYVAGRYGTAFVRGVQSQGVAAVPKHFAANNQETDRFRIDEHIDERTLREIYLPAFEHTVRDAGPWALMCAYNKVNGEWASQHHELLTSILREEWGFDGTVVSDWGAVVDRVAAVAAGLDIEMPPSGTDQEIVDAVRQGRLDEHVLDLVAERVARLATRTASVRSAGRTPIDVDAGDVLARTAAQESIVLLRNDGVLPLDASAGQKIAVVGEFARTPRFQGGGSSHVVPTGLHDALTALRGRFGEVGFAPGYQVPGVESAADPRDLITEATELASGADVVVAFVGYPESAESEGADKTAIDLPADQGELLDALAATGTPLVVVLSGGGVIVPGSWATHSAALLEGWLLGQAGGQAIVDVLAGDVNPSGHLAETIPVDLRSTPTYLTFPGADGHVVYGEGLFVGYRYYDTLEAPVAYPFGHGLSYTTFDLTDLTVEPTGPVTAVARCTVTNTGTRRGAAVPQIYVRSGSASRPVHELKSFQRVELEAGETRQAQFELDARAFATWNAHEHRWRVLPGTYQVELAASSRDIRAVADFVSSGDGLVATLTPMSTIGEWLAHPRGAQVLRPLVERITAGLGGDPTPEMRAMFEQMPLVKLASWGIGVSVAMVEAMAAQANAPQTTGEQAARLRLPG